MFLKFVAVLLMAIVPITVSAAWQVLISEQGRRVEINQDSIVSHPDAMVTVSGRIVLDKPIVDPKTSSSYRIIEIDSRFDCAGRVYATLKRTYFREEGEPLRQEEVRNPLDIPVRSGTNEERIMREVCRQPATTEDQPIRPTTDINETLDRVNKIAEDIRKANEALIEQAVKRDWRRSGTTPASVASGKSNELPDRGEKTSQAERSDRPKPESAVNRTILPPPPSAPDWAYDGNNGPEFWSKLRPEFSVCATGQRQSPIDLHDGLTVDLEPIQFQYEPTAFRVNDALRQLQLDIQGTGAITLHGKQYLLSQIQFHNPSEFAIGGLSFDMEAQLIHKSEDGKLVIVSVLLEKGTENSTIQTALNYLPLERGGEVAPTQRIDINPLLPSDRRYFTFMGSLTVPPCTEGVLWLVFKQPQQISPEQLTIFQRFYRPNARPLQPSFGRIIKESR